MTGIDMEAVADIIADLRNGEHMFWDEGWGESNAQLLVALTARNADLASERAKRVEAEEALREQTVQLGQAHDALVHRKRESEARALAAENLAFDRLEQLIAAEATIERARNMPQPLDGNWFDHAQNVALVLANADTSALARHDAEVWDEGFADGRRQDAEGDDGPKFFNPYRARAAEKRAEQ